MAKCSCIRNNNYDFNLNVYSCYSLIYTDLSEWMTEEQYVIPESYNVEVTSPDGQKAILTIKTDQANKITSEHLYSIPGLCITDGVYCFKIDNCQDIITKSKAITCKLECRKDSLVIKASSDEDWENIKEIESHISAIHSQANIGNFTEANKEYKFAKKLLDNLNCDC